jgi:dolichol-phosphate mannosyltransferase
MKTVTIIIPCYNEHESIPQLFTQLTLLNESLKDSFITHYLFVDDGSTDNTYEELSRNIQILKNAEVVRHKVNQNLGAALKTGIKHAPQCDYLAFLDSDCTYEPAILIKLLIEADKGADIVTVSPYHPNGLVEGVPKWRIFLSKGLTFLYRLFVSKNLYTFTAMVRVIRKDKIESILTASNDFSFVAETLIKGVDQGYKIVEVPTVLRVRKFGVSKMNLIKTIKSHIEILKKIILREEL